MLKPKNPKEESEIGIIVGQEQNQPKRLTNWSKLILGLMLLKILATIISLFWGMGNAIYYFQQVKSDYYPLVFYDSDQNSTSSNTTTTDSTRYVLVTNNISNYTAYYPNLETGTKLMYNHSTMVYCRIYRFDQRAVFLTLNDNSLTEIENSQFTSTPLGFTDTTFFRFQFAVEVILVVMSGCLYLWTLTRDVIAFRNKDRQLRGIVSPTEAKRRQSEPKTCFYYVKRTYFKVKGVLFLLIIDVGFINIYNTKLYTCLTNKPPSRDLIAGLLGQSNLETSDFSDYNLTVGTSQVWMNMIAFCALSYFVYRLLAMGASTLIRLCKKENESEKRCRKTIDVITEVLEMALLLFLSTMLIIWRIFYLDWSEYGDTFAVTGKEILTILTSIVSCCRL